MDEKDFIEKQSVLIDKLIEKNQNDNKYDTMKDCFIALLAAIVAIVFLRGYWNSTYDTGNYSNSIINNADNGGEVKNDG